VSHLAEQILAAHDYLDVLDNNAEDRSIYPAICGQLPCPHVWSHLLEPLIVHSALARVVNVGWPGRTWKVISGGSLRS
jgi:hypothetical protein